MGQTSVHASPPRPRNRRRSRFAHARRSLRTVGQATAYVLMVVLLVIAVGLTVVSFIDLAAPIVWGTYTETECVPRLMRGCDSYGNFRSDDGETVLIHTALDGWATGGTVRAAFRPNSIIGGNDIVHAGVLVFAAPLVSIALVTFIGGATVRQAIRWGHLSALWSKTRRPPQHDGTLYATRAERRRAR